MVGAEADQMVCPVTNAALLQPTVQQPFGNFSVRSSTMNLFAASPFAAADIRHIVKDCWLPGQGQMCDLLWMDGLQSLGTGSFFVKYAPADGSPELITEVLYGKEQVQSRGG